jgi:hypothetical protein
MKIIAPCCGRSSRYPDLPPKWMLPAHDGRPMIALAMADVATAPRDIVVTILAEHEKRYAVRAGLEAAFGTPVDVVMLDEPTRSQSETVAKTLERIQIREPFLVKDSDNTFHIEEVEQEYNYVCVDSLNNFDSINPRNKSYVQKDQRGLITNIREKVVISDLFSVGGYFFVNPSHFLEQYYRLTKDAADWQRELYISDVIGAMILDGVPFRAREVTRYEDWGTVHEWRRALLSRRTLLVSLDGFVFGRGSLHFSPKFDAVSANPKAVQALKSAASQGHAIVYLSIRPAALGELTRSQMQAASLPAGPVVFDLPVSRWDIVTAPDPTLPFVTSGAVELEATDEDMLNRMLGE